VDFWGRLNLLVPFVRELEDQMLGVLVIAVTAGPRTALPNPPYSTSGRNIVKGNQVLQLFGFTFGGLERRDLIIFQQYENMFPYTNGPAMFAQVVQAMFSKGFNVVRIPLAVSTIYYWSRGKEPGKNGNTTVPDYEASDSGIPNNAWCVDRSTGTWTGPADGCHSQLEALDGVIYVFEQQGMKFFFDLHSLHAGGFTDQVIGGKQAKEWERLWYDSDSSGYQLHLQEDDWVDAAKWMVQRYKGSSAMIGIDVANERHGSCEELATAPTSGTKWDGSNDANNYKRFIEKVGEAVHTIDNNLLIIVEGTQCYQGHDTNWGGNLRAVKDFPIELSTPNKVVYSPHEYGPGVSDSWWFGGSAISFESLWVDHFYDDWFYIYDQCIAPILIGEWGKEFDSGLTTLWFQATLWLIHEYSLSQTYWQFCCSYDTVMLSNSAGGGTIQWEDIANELQTKPARPVAQYSRDKNPSPSRSPDGQPARTLPPIPAPDGTCRPPGQTPAKPAGNVATRTQSPKSRSQSTLSRSQTPEATPSGSPGATPSAVISLSFALPVTVRLSSSGTCRPTTPLSGSSAFHRSSEIGATRAFIQSGVFTASPDFSGSNTSAPSGEFSSTESFTDSVSFVPTRTFGPTDTFSASDEFTSTRFFSASSVFVATEVFSMSNLFGDTGTFTHSPFPATVPSSASWSPSTQFAASAPFSATQPSSEPDSFSPTSALSDTAPFTDSETFEASVAPLTTGEASPSVPGTVSGLVTASRDFMVSEVFTPSDLFAPSRSFIPDPTVSATPDPTSELAALAGAWIGASLSSGALVLAVLCALLLLLLLLLKKKKSTKQPAPEEDDDPFPPMDEDTLTNELEEYIS
jgi:endoglucanase